MIKLMCVIFVLLTSQSRQSSFSGNSDAFQFLHDFNKGYIKYKNFNDSRLCVTLSKTEENSTAKFVVYEVFFQTISDGTPRVQYQLDEVQSNPNTVKVFNFTDGTLLYEYTLINNVHNACGIFKGISPNNNCAVLVFNNATNRGLATCRRIFNARCGPNVIDVFDKHACKKRP